MFFNDILCFWFENEVSSLIEWNIKINPEQTQTANKFRLRKNKHLMHLSCFKWNWSLNFSLIYVWASQGDDGWSLSSVFGHWSFPSVHFLRFSSSLSHIVAWPTCTLTETVAVCRRMWQFFFVIVNVVLSVFIGRATANGEWAGKLKRGNAKNSKCHWENVKIWKIRFFGSGKIIFVEWKIWIVTRFSIEWQQRERKKNHWRRRGN